MVKRVTIYESVIITTLVIINSIHNIFACKNQMQLTNKVALQKSAAAKKLNDFYHKYETNSLLSYLRFRLNEWTSIQCQVGGPFQNWPFIISVS